MSASDWESYALADYVNQSVSEERHGEQVLTEHPALGLTDSQAIQLFGEPDEKRWIRTAGLSWLYTKRHHIALDFKGGICVSANAYSSPPVV